MSVQAVPSPAAALAARAQVVVVRAPPNFSGVRKTREGSDAFEHVGQVGAASGRSDVGKVVQVDVPVGAVVVVKHNKFASRHRRRLLRRLEFPGR